jgi:hypothetical protein
VPDAPRRRVSRVERDGRKRGRLADRDLKSAVRRGRSAAKRQVERWCNPHLPGIRATAWTFGWNQEHTLDGACAGCRLCGVGTPVPEPYREWIRKHQYRRA